MADIEFEVIDPEEIGIAAEKYKGDKGDKGEKGDTGDITPEAQALYGEMVTMKESVETSEANAKTSEDNAKTSETNAKASEDNALASKNSAKESENNAKLSETNASTSASEALASKNSAKESETSAKTSEDNAKTSEDNALASKNSAEESATTATEQATIATTKATEASASATQASASETNASTYADNASTSASEALASKNSAKESADSVAESAEQITTNKKNIETIQDDLNQYLYKTYTVYQDIDNSNPRTSLTYSNDAIGMEAGSEKWDEIFQIKPFLFKDGEEVVELDKDNFNQDINGNTIDITSGDSGDVMIRFKRLGYRIVTANGIREYSITTSPNNPDFCYYPFNDGEEREYFYLGAYKSFIDGDLKMRSLSGKTITANKTIDTFRTYAENNGIRYHQSGFFQLLFRQILFIIKYKTLDSQIAVGVGFKGDSAIPTGGSEEYGMCMENCTGTEKTDWDHHAKCFGLEDCWMNIHEFIDGAVKNADNEILVNYKDYNNAGTNYIDTGKKIDVTEYTSGYINNVIGDSVGGLIPQLGFNGSSTTYFCDYSSADGGSRVACFGGTWYWGSRAGAFALGFDSSPADLHSYVAGRVMFL